MTRLLATIPSRASAAAAAGCTALVCLVIALASTANTIVTSLAVFLVAVVGSHVTAVFASKWQFPWQVLDYVLDLVTVVSLLAAAAAIEQSAVNDRRESQLAKQGAEQASLVYTLEGVIEGDCHPKESRQFMRGVSPEPYVGACDRIEHFLPQIKFQFSKNIDASSLVEAEAWARNILVEEANATGSWEYLYDRSRSFIASCKLTVTELQKLDSSAAGFMATLANSGKLRHWQYLLAFTLGLRFARRTAGILFQKHKAANASAEESSPNKPLQPIAPKDGAPVER